MYVGNISCYIFFIKIDNGNFTGLGKPFTGIFYMHFINSFFYNMVPDIIGAFHIKAAFIITKTDVYGTGIHKNQLRCF